MKQPICSIVLNNHQQKQFYAFVANAWHDFSESGYQEDESELFLAVAILDKYFAPATVSKIKSGLHSGKFRMTLMETVALHTLISYSDLERLNQYEPTIGLLIQGIHPFILNHTNNPYVRLFQNIEPPKAVDRIKNGS